MTNTQPRHFGPTTTRQLGALALRLAPVLAAGAVGIALGGGGLAIAATIVVAALIAVHLFVLAPVRILTDDSTIVYARGYRRREQWPRRLTRFTALPRGGGFAAWTAGDHVTVRCRHYSAAELDALLRALNADPLHPSSPRDATSVRDTPVKAYESGISQGERSD